MNDQLAANPALSLLTTVYRKFLEVRPGEHRIWCQLGVALTRQKRAEDATRAFAEARKHSPSEAWTHYLRSVECFFADRMGEAIAEQQKAKRLCPGELTEREWSELNLAFSRQGTWGEIATVCRQLVELSPKLIAAWRWLADALAAEGAHAESEQAWKRLAALCPEDADPWRKLASLYAAQNEPKKQIDALQRYLEGQPEDVNEWCNLGAILGWQGQFPESIHAYQQALAIEPENADTWGKLAAAFAKAGDRSRELEAYRRLQELQPAPRPATQLSLF